MRPDRSDGSDRTVLRRGLTIPILLFFLITPMKLQTQTRSHAFQKIKPIPEALTPLRFSEIKPSGWLADQIRQNLDGCIGRLPELVPDLMVKDDIFGQNRLTRHVKSKDVGAIVEPGDWQVQLLWWNSETQGNWLDGYCRSAILTADSAHLRNARLIIDRILATQDSDGYIGIYDRDLRYRFEGENGELWSKTVLYRALLAWYEYTLDRSVLDAIVRAVDNVMENYPVGSSHPFYAQKPIEGGMTHGLMFTDVLESLYRITRNDRYRGYALFLYQDFSDHFPDEDAQFDNTVNQQRDLTGHGVHTYEHLRAIASAYHASGNPELRKALEGFLHKIEGKKTPSGAPIGDEFIGGRVPSPTTTGYEYCSLQELMHGYTDLLLKSGDARFGDESERIFFNAAQGARHPRLPSIAYLKTDNSYAMNGVLNHDTISNPKQTRYKYSAVHQDAAVCCVPNAGRMTPYYVQNMWMRHTEGRKDILTATLLGPCNVATTIDGKPVRIDEVTGYPYDNKVSFVVDNRDSATFLLRVRIPMWARRTVSTPQASGKDGFLLFPVTGTRQQIDIEFGTDVEVRQFAEERYLCYGPLVYARGIAHREQLKERYPVAGFQDRYYTDAHDTLYALPENPHILPIRDEKTGHMRLKADLINTATGRKETILLLPLGETILRQVTFR